MRSLIGHADAVYSVAFSPDGRILASASTDKSIKLWDVATGRELRTLGGQPDGVRSVVFSPDGKTLASASDDKTVKFWDASTGKELRTLEGHSDKVLSVAFSPDSKVVASGSLDRTIKVWEAASGAELRTLTASALFRSDEKESDDSTEASSVDFSAANWLVLTPNGLFDGSSAALDSIHWRVGPNTTDVVPLEAFFAEFYAPGLLSDVLAGKTANAPDSVSVKDRRQPLVKISLADAKASTGATAASSRNVAVRVEVIETPANKGNPAGSGAQDVRLFRNGLLVKAWRGDVLKGRSSAMLEATIPIVAGENRLTAYAFNRDNVKSVDGKLIVNGAESLKRDGTVYIITVGINQYANPQYNLKFAVADAQSFGNELSRAQTETKRFASVEIISLLDQEATKANILLALKRLAGSETETLPAGAAPALEKIKPAEPEDAVIVYFSGHGSAQPSHYYLIPHDLGYLGSRSGFDKAAIQTVLEHSISDEELRQAFEKIDAGLLALVMDSSGSGKLLESRPLMRLAYEKGMYILSGDQGNQHAGESAQLGHGYLTYALVEEGLKNQLADITPKDGEVTLREWLQYAVQRVPQMLAERGKGKGQQQNPRLFSPRESSGRSFIVTQRNKSKELETR